MNSRIATKSLIRCRKGVLLSQVRRSGNSRCLCAATSSGQRGAAPSDDFLNGHNYLFGSILAATALLAHQTQSNDDSNISYDSENSRGPKPLLFSPTTTTAEPRKYMTNRSPGILQNQPRNVMPLHRMTSTAGRGLKDKYKVDWKTVLGEGAYGSVHPARVAKTGEKVRKISIIENPFLSDYASRTYIILILIANIAYIYILSRSPSRRLQNDTQIRQISRPRPMLFFESLTMEDTQTFPD